MQIRTISRCNSMIYRMANSYFDIQLQKYHLGSGQQFFLFHISQNEGISLQGLAKRGHYDKGTVTRAVKKLEEVGYVRTEPDTIDKRVKHVYTTKRAGEVIIAARESVENWVRATTDGFSEEEILQAANLLERMAENAACFTKALRQEEGTK